MRIKIVALADPSTKEKLRSLDIRERGDHTYREVLLFTMKGAYGVPEIVGIRYPPEREEKAYAVHYGHDIRNQEENIMEFDDKDSLVYKYSRLGFNPIGEFTVTDFRFAWREFEGNFVCVKETGSCFLRLFRNFLGSDTEIFEEKQRRAWALFEKLGIRKEQVLPMDYWGFLVMSILQSKEGSTPQS